MKRLIGFAIIACSLSIPAFAAKNSHDVTFASAVKVGTTQLKSGEYKVSWTGSDASAQVTISQNGKVLATAPAKVVKASNPQAGISTSTVNGTQVVDAIQLEKLNLVLSDTQASGQ